MLLRRVAIENVRSFLERQELLLNGPISIIVGPNGGGKTNLLDCIVVMLRRYLFTSIHVQTTKDHDNKVKWNLSPHHSVNGMLLERHLHGSDRDQIIEVEVEISSSDVLNMSYIKNEYANIHPDDWSYSGFDLVDPLKWNIDEIIAGNKITYTLLNGEIVRNSDNVWLSFLEYLRIFEAFNWITGREGAPSMRFPLLNLPTTRAANFASSVQLSGFNQWETKVNTDANYSRTGTSVTSLAVGALARKFRLLLENDDGKAKKTLDEDISLAKIKEFLAKFGYDWGLQSTDPLSNAYDVILEKSGTKFHLSAGSSGEREFMTYIFAVFALDIRDALIVVDEPELHLHPRWQRSLLGLFEDLARSTGNHFLLATHSPSFISPSSIHYVSRIHNEPSGTQITPINIDALPQSKKLMELINYNNNEKIFFADKVLLVEGITDKIFIEAFLSKMETGVRGGKVLEVVAVHGKHLFADYGKLLAAGLINYAVIADLDYVEQIGPSHLKKLFSPNYKSIKKDIIENYRSKDGAELVKLIDYAMDSGDWTASRNLWDYIKGRRLAFKAEIGDSEKEEIFDFVDAQAKNGIFILRRGALEDYLPQNVRSKDVDQVVSFVNSAEFWQDLKDHGRDEIELILRQVLDFDT